VSIVFRNDELLTLQEIIHNPLKTMPSDNKDNKNLVYGEKVRFTPKVLIFSIHIYWAGYKRYLQVVVLSSRNICGTFPPVLNAARQLQSAVATAMLLAVAVC
jgi:hypothetical protein